MTEARTVILRGGPADGQAVKMFGGMRIQVPLQSRPGIYMHDKVAVYDYEGVYQETERGPGVPFPECPTCGRPMQESVLTLGCLDPDCVLVMCGATPDCPLAMHWKPA